MAAEAEAAAGSWRGRAEVAEARVSRDAAAAAEAQSIRDTAAALAVERARELAEGRLLHEGLVRELGLMSSRYARLQQAYEGLQLRRAQQRSRPASVSGSAAAAVAAVTFASAAGAAGGPGGADANPAVGVAAALGQPAPAPGARAGRAGAPAGSPHASSFNGSGPRGGWHLSVFDGLDASSDSQTPPGEAAQWEPLPLDAPSLGRPGPGAAAPGNGIDEGGGGPQQASGSAACLPAAPPSSSSLLSGGSLQQVSARAGAWGKPRAPGGRGWLQGGRTRRARVCRARAAGTHG